MLKMKRAYEKRSEDDGLRIFVDRLWPRGLSHEQVAADEWLQDLSPSDELRRWFRHEPDRFPEFRQRYLRELSDPEKTALLRKIAKLARETTVTLVYGAKDQEHNNAKVLTDFIEKILEGKVRPD
jgi:uncharacterized protein YeaO (DUF488 family)